MASLFRPVIRVGNRSAGLPPQGRLPRDCPPKDFIATIDREMTDRQTDTLVPFSLQHFYHLTLNHILPQGSVSQCTVKTTLWDIHERASGEWLKGQWNARLNKVEHVSLLKMIWRLWINIYCSVKHRVQVGNKTASFPLEDNTPHRQPTNMWKCNLEIYLAFDCPSPFKSFA